MKTLEQTVVEKAINEIVNDNFLYLENQLNKNIKKLLKKYGVKPNNENINKARHLYFKG